MKTSLVTAAATSYPVSLADVKTHLRVTSTIDDSYIQDLIKVAVKQIEDVTGRRLIKQTWTAYYDNWPVFDSIELPYGPVLNVPSTGVVYTDSTGNSTTLSSTKWSEDTVSDRGRVVLEDDDEWPTATLHPNNPIAITADYGYSTGSTSVPDTIKQAVKMTVSHFYENREPGVMGRIYQEIPGTVKSLLASYRLHKY